LIEIVPTNDEVIDEPAVQDTAIKQESLENECQTTFLTANQTKRTHNESLQRMQLIYNGKHNQQMIEKQNDYYGIPKQKIIRSQYLCSQLPHHVRNYDRIPFMPILKQ
jgi:hypothetical protein